MDLHFGKFVLKWGQKAFQPVVGNEKSRIQPIIDCYFAVPVLDSKCSYEPF